MSPNPVIIKKYENRRLYDTTNSRYINQDEVARMLQDGCEVQVIDAATGEDLTRLVLTQIIVEQAKAPDSAFPLDILRQMVIASSRATQESTLQYMKAVLEMYQNAYRAMAPKMNPFGFMKPAPVRPAPVVDFPPSDSEVRVRPAPDPRARGSADEVGELKRRVAELESLVSKRRTKRPRKQKTGSRHKA